MLRPTPERPEKLAWDSTIGIDYVDIGSINIRYIKTGSGPNLVLLHTLRTQLDIFRPIVPELAKYFTVYAFDYPGHGWSDIPKAAYAPEDFYKWTAGFLEALGIREATLGGISIGGTASLVLAARHNPRVAGVVSVNPYDYWPTGGIRKSSLAARLVLTFAQVPILGATIMRLRNRLLFNRILEGGVSSRAALTEDLAADLYDVGNRPGHYQAFLSLLAHERLWAEAHKEYSNIAAPVLLVYGERDWAPYRARRFTKSLIPEVRSETVPNGGHFLVLDCPHQLGALIVGFANRYVERSHA